MSVKVRPRFSEMRPGAQRREGVNTQLGHGFSLLDPGFVWKELRETQKRSFPESRESLVTRTFVPKGTHTPSADVTVYNKHKKMRIQKIASSGATSCGRTWTQCSREGYG